MNAFIQTQSNPDILGRSPISPSLLSLLADRSQEVLIAWLHEHAPEEIADLAISINLIRNPKYCDPENIESAIIRTLNALAELGELS